MYVDVLFISQLIYIGMHIERDYMIVGSVNFCVHDGIVGTVSWFISVSLYFSKLMFHYTGVVCCVGFSVDSSFVCMHRTVFGAIQWHCAFTCLYYMGSYIHTRFSRKL